MGEYAVTQIPTICVCSLPDPDIIKDWIFLKTFALVYNMAFSCTISNGNKHMPYVLGPGTNLILPNGTSAF
jgi:hypothetical protein